MLTRSRESGAITVLAVGFAATAILLLLVGVAASKVFLARRALAAAADQAALSAAQGINTARLYRVGLRCGALLPLDPAEANRRAGESFADSRPDLRRVFTSLDRPGVVVRGGAVAVSLAGTVRLPLAAVLGHLDPGHGRVDVTETARARSPVTSC
jgi:hypothetical protein